jgi:Arc/MetJ-type ribon-helix-helix transcriptional regulator
MTVKLPKDLENSINAEVLIGNFPSADDLVTQIVREYLQHKQQPAVASQRPPAEPSKPIWEIADELRKNVPAEEWAKLPVDGASQHDHYIYGTPKHPKS